MLRIQKMIVFQPRQFNIINKKYWKQQNQSEKPKTLVKTNPNSSTSNKGYVDVVILSLVISFVAGMLTIIMYSILK